MADKRDPNITLMADIIQEEVEKLGLVYSAGKWERARIRNILTAKVINTIAEKHKMDIFVFVRTIIEFSGKLSFWKGKIRNGETFYRNYVQVLNELIILKQKKEPKIQKIDKADSDFSF